MALRRIARSIATLMLCALLVSRCSGREAVHGPARPSTADSLNSDLAIVANCEEWWEEDIEFRFFWDPRSNPDSVAVVWFENRLNEALFSFEERQGLCFIEAENWTDLLDGAWVQGARCPGYSGHGYLQDRNALDSSSPSWEQTRGVRYFLRLSGGSYVFWLRRWVPSRWGFALSGLGGRRSQWVRIGLDGSPLEECCEAPSVPFDFWQWVRCEGRVVIDGGTRSRTSPSQWGGRSRPHSARFRAR